MTEVRDEASDKLDDEAVANFLVHNKDFFSRNPELLDTLDLPHDSGNATSLVERQVSILRERNIDARKRLADLIRTASDNDRLFKKTRILTLALLDANSLVALDDVLAEQLVDGFDAEHAICYVLDVSIGNHAHLVALDKSAAMPVPRLFSQPSATCGTYRPEEYARLFDDHSLTEPGSAVLVPMRLEGLNATLAIGSPDPTRFSREMGTLFLEYIGDVLGRTLLRLMKLG
ncbi:MAG: DUF484 family protein [Gammaproteobacteria bacterium]|nr:DUF484 family protein [Gammaproteobacteria bacterium]